MNKYRISSPLRHEEGNEAAHGMRTNEAAWHAENPDVVAEGTEEESTIETPSPKTGTKEYNRMVSSMLGHDKVLKTTIPKLIKMTVVV